MKKNFFFAITFTLSSALAGVPPETQVVGVTYEDCLHSALKVSETLGDQVEQVKQAEERERQATGSVLPAVNGVASYFTQDTSNLPPQINTSPNSYYSNSQPLVKLNIIQHLFRGFSEYAALRQTKILTKAQSEQKDQALLQLQIDVASAFFNTLSLENDEKNLATEMGLYQKRIKELQGRINIGRSRRAESLTVDSTLAALEAQYQQVRYLVQNSRDTLNYLTRFDRGVVLKDTSNIPETLPPLENFLATLEARPDIESAKDRVSAAVEGISVAKGTRLPAIDFQGNYYFLRSGTLQNSTWDALFTLTLPLFAGGVIDSQVRFAASQDYQAELNLRRVRKLAENDIRANYQNVTSDGAQISALQRSVAVGKQNYEIQTRDYRFGLVTNIDVVTSVTVYEESVRALDRATYAQKLDYIRLQSSSGKLF